MTPAIEVNGLTKSFGHFSLERVSFSLSRGHIMGLVGPNGAGKTTRVKLLLGLLRRDAGEVRLLGYDTLREAPEILPRLGFVLDTPCFYPHLKPAVFGQMVGRFYPTWDPARFHKLCREFELPLDRRIGRYSRGMKMKLALVLALAHDAELIVMDEPTAGLDPVFRRQLLERLAALIQDERRAVLFSTHITSDLERVADFITCLDQGRILFSSTRDEIHSRWALVRGGGELLEPGLLPLLRGVARGAFGFRALTDRAGEVRARLRDTDAVVERASLDDLMSMLHRRDSHA